MSETNIPAAKAPRDQRRESCLHCCVLTAIEEWFQHHGNRRDGVVVIDVIEVSSKLAECTVEIINSLPERSQRRSAMRFAHDALDANMKSQNRGKLIAVEIPTEQ